MDAWWLTSFRWWKSPEPFNGSLGRKPSMLSNWTEPHQNVTAVGPSGLARTRESVFRGCASRNTWRAHPQNTCTAPHVSQQEVHAWVKVAAGSKRGTPPERRLWASTRPAAVCSIWRDEELIPHFPHESRLNDVTRFFFFFFFLIGSNWAHFPHTRSEWKGFLFYF